MMMINSRLRCFRVWLFTFQATPLERVYIRSIYFNGLYFGLGQKRIRNIMISLVKKSIFPLIVDLNFQLQLFIILRHFYFCSASSVWFLPPFFFEHIIFYLKQNVFLFHLFVFHKYLVFFFFSLL